MKIKTKLVEIINEYIPQPSAYRVFVLYGAPLNRKTKIALELVKEFEGKYIDLLEELPNIKPKIGFYSPAELKMDINKWTKECKSLLVIDEIEPLLDTWSVEDKKNFFKLMTKWRTECVVLIVSRLNLSYENLLGKNRAFTL